MTQQLAFIAIGGNSLIRSKALMSVEDQHRAIRETIHHVADLIALGYQVVISHGNGPQVGFILLRSEVARRETGLHPVPLVSVVADTQGAIGYQIQQALGNALTDRQLAGQCVTVVTQVVVDRTDPGFAHPAKPVGEFYTPDQAATIRRDFPHWHLAPDAGRGFRRLVPSPRPLAVVETPAIRTLLANGYHVVAAGGGGIPVVQTEAGLEGVDAVVDKDLTASLLAREVGAELLIVSTAVEQVALHYGGPHEAGIGTMTVAEAETYMAAGHFAPGSMLPKIQAAVAFLKAGGREVIITAPAHIRDAVVAGKGTHVIP